MEIIITIKDDGNESVNVKVEKPKVEIKPDREALSIYARFFDAGCPGWDKNSEHNLLFLKQQQNFANDLLKVQGYLLLNDVYDMLGIPRSKTGQVVGWIYDKEHPVGDNHVDFGIYSDRNQEFVNGYNNSPLLDFNVDGNILDVLEEKKGS